MTAPMRDPGTDQKLIVYRVQAIDGRGPWRPGFSHVWVDDIAKPPAWIEEFNVRAVLRAANGDVTGCACRSLDQLRRWFTQDELNRLRVLGYFVVRLEVDRILAESKHQVVFARKQPLAMDVETVHM